MTDIRTFLDFCIKKEKFQRTSLKIKYKLYTKTKAPGLSQELISAIVHHYFLYRGSARFSRYESLSK